MNYSEEFEKVQWTKKEIHELIKNKGKISQKQKLSDIDRLTLKYIQETKTIGVGLIAEAIEENTLSELMEIARNTFSFSSWNLARTMKIVFTPVYSDIEKSINNLNKLK